MDFLKAGLNLSTKKSDRTSQSHTEISPNNQYHKRRQIFLKRNKKSFLSFLK